MPRSQGGVPVIVGPLGNQQVRNAHSEGIFAIDTLAAVPQFLMLFKVDDRTYLDVFVSFIFSTGLDIDHGIIFVRFLSESTKLHITPCEPRIWQRRELIFAQPLRVRVSSRGAILIPNARLGKISVAFRSLRARRSAGEEVSGTADSCFYVRLECVERRDRLMRRQRHSAKCC